MLAKIAVLLQSKVAVAVLGAILIGGGGATVAAAAATGHLPVIHSGSPTATAKADKDAQSGSDGQGHEVALEGTLKAYDASNGTISVLGEHDGGQNAEGDATPSAKPAATHVAEPAATHVAEPESTQGAEPEATHAVTVDAAPTTFVVDNKTKVNGEHATSLADLTNAIGHKVQVQAEKQSNGTLLASKVTVEGATDQEGQGDEHNAEVHGAIAAVGTDSFAVKGDDGKQVTVTVNAQTSFAGAVHSLKDLKAGQRVEVSGTTQADGTVLASRVAAESVDGSAGSGGRQHGADVRGAVASVAADSFVVTGVDAKQVTVHVGAQTAFVGAAHVLGDLKTGEQVDVLGAAQPDGSIAAVAVRAGAGN